MPLKPKYLIGSQASPEAARVSNGASVSEYIEDLERTFAELITQAADLTAAQGLAGA